MDLLGGPYANTAEREALVVLGDATTTHPEVGAARVGLLVLVLVVVVGAGTSRLLCNL